jgi:hypothetical protein
MTDTIRIAGTFIAARRNYLCPDNEFSSRLRTTPHDKTTTPARPYAHCMWCQQTLTLDPRMAMERKRAVGVMVGRYYVLVPVIIQEMP